MLKWQKIARWLLLAVVLACVVAVAATLRKRTTPIVPVPLTPTDPKAVVENAGGVHFRVNRDKEEIRVRYETLLTYADGTTKMMGVKVTTDRDGRTFEITGDEGRIGDKESTVELVGHVRVTATDGLVLTTERATYAEAEGIARAPGPVEFSRGRMSGKGIGFNYDKNQDILTILEQPIIHVVADERGAGAMDVSSGGLEFRRNEHLLRFDRSMKGTRDGQVVEADSAVAHVTADEQSLESLELRGQSRINVSSAAPGGLQALTGRDIDIKYGPDGHAIEHALINGDAVIQLAGDGKSPGRQINAAIVDVSLAPDGTTPIALTARENVRLSLPAEQSGVNRAIAAQLLESRGDGSRGLTSARFSENVQFSERGGEIDRAARSTTLEVTLAPGFASIEEARFTRGVRFVDHGMTATAAMARYVPGNGTLELTGSEPASPTPHVVNEQIVIDAGRLDITLEGPKVKGTGAVKSVLQPKKPGAAGQDKAASDVHVPSMLKQDQPVNVTADGLDYDGNQSRGVYTGNVLLWQGETSIRASTLTIDSEKGDLAAQGPVTTATVLVDEGKDGTKERVRSRGVSKEFAYREDDRRATYTGDAQLTGPQGDLSAARIELYLKESGDTIDRAEAFDDVSLRAEAQKTTGKRLTYFGDEGRYVVHGTPVKIVDTCGRETIGRTLTFFKSTDRIIIDGSAAQIRPQTKGTSNCPGT